ncbi:hypothetical protein ABGB12_11395 [Actinocorallia sp. B10E7]|uniref:hypothetical protein n=1 Tax=Actinocorallia sp. B10E7 TaxID=3153558 RepID=UPI00325F7E30
MDFFCTAALLRAPSPEAACSILTDGRYGSIDVHRWTPGGRPAPRPAPNDPETTTGRSAGTD